MPAQVPAVMPWTNIPGGCEGCVQLLQLAGEEPHLHIGDLLNRE